jgi:hypothetical protein
VNVNNIYIDVLCRQYPSRRTADPVGPRFSHLHVGDSLCTVFMICSKRA